MATGGQHGASKELQQNGELSNNGNSFGDRPLQWTLLPNNLELNARPKPTKKQRNKDKSRGALSAENLSSVHPANSNRNSGSKFLDRGIPPSDNDHAPASKRNIKVSVNQQNHGLTFQVAPSRSTMENENMPSSKEVYSKKQPDTAIITERLAHLKDCIAQVNSVLQHLEQSDEPRIMDQVSTMKGIREDLLEKQSIIQDLLTKSSKEEVGNLEDIRNRLSQEEQSNKALLQQMVNETLTGLEENDQASSARSSFSSKVSDGTKRREVNGHTHYTEEDKANIQNHLLEKMKVSQEKLSALRQQQSVLLSMHKKAEDRLAAFQAELAKNSAESPQSDHEWQYPLDASPFAAEEVVPNGSAAWEKDFSNSHIQWLQQNSHKPVKNEQSKFQASGWKEPQDLSKLHVNLDHIKRRLELLQQFSDNRNVAEPVSPLDIPIDDENLGQTVVAVEWQRKKLKNRLLELMEKKKASDELMKELSLIKEAANAVDGLKEEDASLSLANIQDGEQGSSLDENDRTLEDLQETISQLRGMLSSTTQPDATATKNPHVSVPAKRDNIKKEQGDQFPVRRHYEAEGRANEDADLPAVAAAIAPSPDPNAWENDFSLQEKKRKLENAKRKLQLMQELVQSIQDARLSGQHIPSTYLQVLSSLDEAEEADDYDDVETVTDNEESQDNDNGTTFVAEHRTPEVSTNKGAAKASDVSDLLQRSDENDRSDAVERANIDDVPNLHVDELLNEREQLVKLHEKFVKLRHKFTSSPKQNNETRSRAEGGNLAKKKPKPVHSLPVENQLPARQLRQNLLTRQNVESQNRNNSSNIARGNSASLKKDNINDLSAKLSKPVGHCISRPTDLLSKFNTDSQSFGIDMNQSISLQHEFRNRATFDTILKQDHSKPQNLTRNRDIRSNSSVNSEPLDGSSSALAPDTTVAATWGGSSTQDNFEDENEPTESLEEPGEEEESNSGEAVGNILETEPALSVIPNAYGSDQPYTNYSVDSSVKRRDNRLQKYFKSTQLNQWTPRKNFARSGTSSQRMQHSLPSTQPDYPLPEEARGQAEDTSQTSACSISSANPVAMPDKFMQQLQQQLEKLYALCHPILSEPAPHSSCAIPPVHPAQTSCATDRSGQPGFQYPIVHSLSRSSQPVPDVMHNYTQQLHLQQQLLLSLSQCYHTLYMQQLEIQHLHRCLQQGLEPEASVPPSAPQIPLSEDFTFRPWFLNPWHSSAASSALFPPSQVSPLSAPPFLQPNQPSFSFGPNLPPSAAAATATAPCALVTGMQPARAVVHPAAQESRPSSETLNNQVPPRTRANNFWDNFRSYSRQNLLSTPNVTKSKDSGSFSGGPQVRQVHPLVSNESSWNHRSRVFIPPHTESGATSFSQPADRTFVRPVANPEFQEAGSRSKKPNTNRPQAASSQPIVDSSSEAVFAPSPETDQPCRSTAVEDALTVQSHNVSSAENRGPRCGKCVRSKTSDLASSGTSAVQPLPDTIHSEISKLLAQNNNQSGCLEELLRELQNLKSDSLQRAVNVVRELANSDERVGALPGSSRTCDFQLFKVDSQEVPAMLRETFDQLIEDRERTLSPPANSGNSDFHAFRSANESNSQRNNQNWPAATIFPLGKFVPKPSTGAVKKRSVREAIGTTPWSSAGAETRVLEEKVPPSASRATDSLENLVERVILDVIPFIQGHAVDDCCLTLRSNFASKMTDALKTHYGSKLSSEFLSQTQQCLVHMTNKYSSLKWRECESDLLKNAASTLFRELSLYRSVALRSSLEESCDHSSAVPKKNPQPDVLPTSSKSFCEKNKQIIPNKDSREEPLIADSSSSFFSNSAVHEYEGHVGELYINMPSEDAVVSNHYSGGSQNEPSRGSSGGACALVSSGWQVQPANAEDDMTYECDPEAEAEPEVEAGTEADLAEADQSPGQQGSSNMAVPTSIWHAPQINPQMISRGLALVNVEEAACTESGVVSEPSGAMGMAPQGPLNPSSEKEITLDDIPTKLTPMSQEELQKQMAEEQDPNALLLEVVDDLSLAGDGDCPKEPPTFL